MYFCPALYIGYMQRITASNRLKNITQQQWATVIISLALLIASFTQPAFYLEGDGPPHGIPSLMLFFFGWMGAMMGGGFAWLANPLYLASLIAFLLSNTKVTLWLCLGALVLGGSFMLTRSVMVDEAGHMGRVASMQAGYMLWMGAFVALFAGGVLVRVIKRDEHYL